MNFTDYVNRSLNYFVVSCLLQSSGHVAAIYKM